MPLSAFLTYKNSSVHYLQFGSGSKILFAFHGFSESAKSFTVLEPSLGTQYTVIAIDLPYHGLTNWVEHTHFAPDDILSIIRLFLAERSFTRFSVLGFSMGAKCALHITDHLAEDIDDLFLFAADGIKTNPVYNVAVYPAWGRGLFKTTIKHPAWMFALLNLAGKFKLLSPWLKKFARVHMETEEKRQRLYDTWMSMRAFNTDITEVKLKIREYNIMVYLFFGERDEVIPMKVAEFFAAGLPHYKLVKLERGHYFLDEKLNAFITDAIHT